MNIINTNGASPLYGYNPSTHTAKASRTTQDTFSIDALTETKDKADKVSLSAAGIHAADDAVDPPVPEVGMPAWLSKHSIRVSTRLGRVIPDEFPENRKFSNLSSGERIEYFSLLKSHVSSLYERNNLLDEKSKYEALNSESSSERLHRDFIEGIKADPRMFELVKKLGIDLS